MCAMSVMLAIYAHYAGIMPNAFATYYAHNYTSIIGSNLAISIVIMVHVCITTIRYKVSRLMVVSREAKKK